MCVLPVEASDGHHYADGLFEARRHGLDNQFKATFMAPTFSRLLGHADHTTDPEIRQETYLREVVRPCEP